MELRGQDMRCRRIVGFLVGLSLVMNGSMLGSDPEERLQVRWSELKKLIRGKKVVLQLSDGARVEGRVRRVTEPSIVLWVKRSSEPAEYSKGKSEIAREAVSRIEALDLNVTLAKRAKKVALTVGAALGAFAGSAVLLHNTVGPDDRAIGVGVAIGAAVAVLMNLPQRSKDVTLIEIIPASPGEKGPNPTNKDQSSSPTASGEALATSLIEESSAERLRRQSRRAVMRQDLRLDFVKPACVDGLRKPAREVKT